MPPSSGFCSCFSNLLTNKILFQTTLFSLTQNTRVKHICSSHLVASWELLCQTNCCLTIPLPQDICLYVFLTPPMSLSEDFRGKSSEENKGKLFPCAVNRFDFSSFFPLVGTIFLSQKIHGYNLIGEWVKDAFIYMVNI